MSVTVCDMVLLVILTCQLNFVFCIFSSVIVAYPDNILDSFIFLLLLFYYYSF